MAKRVTNKEIIEKLNEIDAKLVHSHKTGRLDAIFAVGVTFAVSSLVVLLNQSDKVPSSMLWLFIIIGLSAMIGTNIYRDLMKNKK